MNRFKRWTIGIFTSVDQAVRKMENHEAMADAYLAEVSQATATAAGRHNQLVAELEKLQQQQRDLEADIVRWRDRAARLAHSDEDKALACLQRLKEKEQRLTQVKQLAEEQHKLVEKMAAELANMRTKLEQYKLKRSQLRSRQARSEALKGMHKEMAPANGGLDSIFEDWESGLASSEWMLNADIVPQDALENELSKQEQEAALRAELADLKQDLKQQQA